MRVMNPPICVFKEMRESEREACSLKRRQLGVYKVALAASEYHSHCIVYSSLQLPTDPHNAFQGKTCLHRIFDIHILN